MKYASLAISIIIFFTSYQYLNSAVITGRVVDSDTKGPISTASITISCLSDQYAILGHTTSSDYGIFEMKVPDNSSIIRIRFEAQKMDDYFVQSEIDSILCKGTISLGTIGMNYLSIHWPIPDSIRNLPAFNRPTKPAPYASPTYRTIKPPCMPRDVLLREIDCNGGEWILFGLMRLNDFIQPLYVTYRYPNGKFENALPTGLYWDKEIKISITPNGIIIDPGKQSNVNWQLSKGLIKLNDLKKDDDKDGLPNLYEQYYCLNPQNPDTDGDGIDDLNDPFPARAFSEIQKDTLDILMSFFDTTGYWNLFARNEFRLVKNALPESVQSWVSKAVEMVQGFNKDHPDWYTEFEQFLIVLSSDQLRTLYPYLKAISIGTTPKSDENNNKFIFPYIESIRDANKSSLDKVRREIMKTNFIHFLRPMRFEGDLLPLGLHTPSKGVMFLGGLPDSCPAVKYWGTGNMESVKILKMSSNAALVRFDTDVFGDEVLLVKRDGRWVQIWKRQIWIE
jgi:hypothetical protein